MTGTSPGAIESGGAAGGAHISVCVCTFKRPELLCRLLEGLRNQVDANSFSYSIVVADNDAAKSARAVVDDFAATTTIPVHYCVEPRRNIALARNKTIENATGDFVAFIDDDEEPFPEWLRRLTEAIERYDVDGVLGPVTPRFLVEPPDWIVRGRFFEKPSPRFFTPPSLQTGTWLRWKQTGTFNALVRRRIFDDPGNWFRPEFGEGGEDRDFFRRMMAKGMRFAWCAEAKVYEAVPAERSCRKYLLGRALRRGGTPYNQGWPVVLSLIGAPVYAAALPFLAVFGQHVFMRFLIKECDHLGRIGAFFVGHLRPERYR